MDDIKEEFLKCAEFQAESDYKYADEAKIKKYAQMRWEQFVYNFVRSPEVWKYVCGEGSWS